MKKKRRVFNRFNRNQKLTEILSTDVNVLEPSQEKIDRSIFGSILPEISSPMNDQSLSNQRKSNNVEFEMVVGKQRTQLKKSPVLVVN